MPSLVYRMPCERQSVAELLDAFSTWTRYHSLLLCPQDLYDNGQVAAHTGIRVNEQGVFSFVGRTHTSFEDERDNPGRPLESTDPNVASVIDGHRLSAFIEYADVPIQQDSLLRFLKRQLRKGYYGYIRVLSNDSFRGDTVLVTAHINDYREQIELEYLDTTRCKKQYLDEILCYFETSGLEKI